MGNSHYIKVKYLLFPSRTHVNKDNTKAISSTKFPHNENNGGHSNELAAVPTIDVI